jgi:hypothetical protein
MAGVEKVNHVYEKCYICARWAAALCLGALLSFMTTIAYWAFLDYKLFPPDRLLSPVLFSSTPEGEPNFTYQAGDTIYVNWHLDVLRECKADFTRSIVNGRSHAIMNLDAQHGVLPETVGKVSFTTQLILDELLRPGEYEYRVRALFRCNPLLPLEKNYPGVWFRIVE